jgi:hypothetical protein
VNHCQGLDAAGIHEDAGEFSNVRGTFLQSLKRLGEYIRQNPMQPCGQAGSRIILYSSAALEFVMDEPPSGLKPSSLTARIAALEALRHLKTIVPHNRCRGSLPEL